MPALMSLFASIAEREFKEAPFRRDVRYAGRPGAPESAKVVLREEEAC